ncbi:MAG: DUF4252 domain-containing protein, partial [Leeuwenhoekiella sp.]
MKILKLSSILLLLLAMVSCNKEQSLQEYYVDNKESDDFVMIDVPTSLISPNSDKLSVDQKKVLKTVKKVNILAYPLSSGTKEKYESE